MPTKSQPGLGQARGDSQAGVRASTKENGQTAQRSNTEPQGPDAPDTCAAQEPMPSPAGRQDAEGVRVLM